ncbi:MAG: hypothetical protein JOZ52_12095, partial [Acidobacteria bacterium]|nr:hypothetical protein [Acidobacteriota bacterium]
MSKRNYLLISVAAMFVMALSLSASAQTVRLLIPSLMLFDADTNTDRARDGLL